MARKKNMHAIPIVSAGKKVIGHHSMTKANSHADLTPPLVANSTDPMKGRGEAATGSAGGKTAPQSPSAGTAKGGPPTATKLPQKAPVPKGAPKA